MDFSLSPADHPPMEKYISADKTLKPRAGAFWWEVSKLNWIDSWGAKLYDLLGLFSPVAIIPKLLLQELWVARCGRDDQVPESILNIWLPWSEELPAVNNFPINRQYCHDESETATMSLHGFSDASNLAMGAAVYIRCRLKDGTIKTTLVLARAKVCPVKRKSIPKLELEAAVLITKLLVYTAKTFKIKLEDTQPWTDSEIELAWLRRCHVEWRPT